MGLATTTARSAPGRKTGPLRSQLRLLWQQLPRGGALPYEVWFQRHRGILALLWLHVPVLFAFALAQHQSLEHSFSEAMAVAPFAAVATAFQHRRRLSTVITALGLLSCSAVLVHLSARRDRDALPLLRHGGRDRPLPGLVALPHRHRLRGASTWRGRSARPRRPSTTTRTRSTTRGEWAGIHGAFILGMSAAGIAAWRLNESLLESRV